MAACRCDFQVWSISNLSEWKNCYLELTFGSGGCGPSACGFHTYQPNVPDCRTSGKRRFFCHCCGHGTFHHSKLPRPWLRWTLFRSASSISSLAVIATTVQRRLFYN